MRKMSIIDLYNIVWEKVNDKGRLRNHTDSYGWYVAIGSLMYLDSPGWWAKNLQGAVNLGTPEDGQALSCPSAVRSRRRVEKPVRIAVRSAMVARRNAFKSGPCRCAGRRCWIYALTLLVTLRRL